MSSEVHAPSLWSTQALLTLLPSVPTLTSSSTSNTSSGRSARDRMVRRWLARVVADSCNFSSELLELELRIAPQRFVRVAPLDLYLFIGRCSLVPQLRAEIVSFLLERLYLLSQRLALAL